jgi:hypothetical protein
MIRIFYAENCRLTVVSQSEPKRRKETKGLVVVVVVCRSRERKREVGDGSWQMAGSRLDLSWWPKHSIRRRKRVFIWVYTGGEVNKGEP